MWFKENKLGDRFTNALDILKDKLCHIELVLSNIFDSLDQDYIINLGKVELIYNNLLSLLEIRQVLSMKKE